MARINGIVKFRGNLGGIIFYQVGNVLLARKKSSLDAKRLKEDPAFVRTLENASEFALAARAGKLLRQAAGRLYRKAMGKKVMLKVNQLMLKAKMLDGISARGQRWIGMVQDQPEVIALLKGFDLGVNHPLSSVLNQPMTTDFATGRMGIEGFFPARDINAAESASHVVLSGCVARVDFAQGTCTVEKTNEVILDLEGSISDIALAPAVVPGGTGLLILLVKVHFVQEVNAQMFVVGEEACAVVGVGE